MNKIKILVATPDETEFIFLRDLNVKLKDSVCEMVWVKNPEELNKIKDAELFDLFLLRDSFLSGTDLVDFYPAVLLSDEQGDKESLNLPVFDVIYKNSLNAEILSRSITYSLDKKLLLDRIEVLSHYDSLTKLPNETLFHHYLEFYFESAKRERRIMALLILDINNLENINKQFGQIAGDNVIKQVAQRLRGYVRKVDPIVRGSIRRNLTAFARVGKDEFIILLGEIKHTADASRVAERIIKAMQNPVTVNNSDISLNVNIGIALYPQDGENTQILEKHATEALATAKKEGKNLFYHWDNKIHTHSLERLKLESEIREFIEKDKLLCYYQPQLDLKTFRITCMEAFLRIARKNGKILPASKFIYVIEEMGLINEVAEKVMHRTCRDYITWKNQGVKPPIISVNLSPHQIGQEDFLKKLFTIIKGYKLPVQAFAFEITERSIEEEDEAVKIIEALEEEGFHILIDDFGKGSSTLNNLRFLPVEGIKIDQSFMKPLTHEPRDAAIVRSIIDLGKFLKLGVVAKRVENADQFVFLREADCDLVQGDFISPPVPASELGSMLLNENSLGSLGSIVQSKL
ncbi:MAG: bifunctional diguanylate cyclase/phosphodiesterase [Spirochaetales bacterium]|nr:bifunctional diguanylate cyclase/phosphodiesterase [Spirochaetales bacterium]